MTRQILPSSKRIGAKQDHPVACVDHPPVLKLDGADICLRQIQLTMTISAIVLIIHAAGAAQHLRRADGTGLNGWCLKAFARVHEAAIRPDQSLEKRL